MYRFNIRYRWQRYYIECQRQLPPSKLSLVRDHPGKVIRLNDGGNWPSTENDLIVKRYLIVCLRNTDRINQLLKIVYFG